jgi:hypothetical protein
MIPRTWFTPLVLLLFATTALAGEREEVLAKVDTLSADGGKLFDTAGNPDLSPRDRNAARKAAYKLLKEAFTLLDKWCEDHPSEAEALEDRMVEIHYKMYWIKKESPIGLIEEKGQTAERPSDWPPEPPADLHEPALGPKARDPEPRDDADPDPEVATPKADPAEVFARITEYERKNPFDLEGCLELYQEFLDRFGDDTDHPFARKAIDRVGALSERLKGAYRRLRDEDPDALDFQVIRHEKKLVLRLSKHLKSKNEEERRRAALDMGALGASMAPYYLAKLIRKDDSAEVVAAAEESIVRIGGKKAAEILEGFARERDSARVLKGIELLAKIGAKDTVQARYASRALGKYLETNEEKVYYDAIAALEGLGQIGWEGFAIALFEVKRDRGRRLDFIRRLGALGEPKAARALGRFLVQKGDRGLMMESIESLKKLGNETVPYLIPFLKGATRTGAGYALREVTGAQLGSKSGPWARWWAENGKK